MRGAFPVWIKVVVLVWIITTTTTTTTTPFFVLGVDKPSPRWGLGCAFVSGALYCYGGQQHNATLSDMYHLDLYKSWDIDEPSWTRDPVGSAGGPATSYYALAVFTNRPLFLINGGSQAISSPSMLYDTQKQQWTSLSGPSYETQRKQHTATTDAEGRLWLWGGVSDIGTYGGATVYHNTWIVMDTNSWSYSYPIVHNAPSPRIDHTATAMPNGQILIMGGVVFSRNITDPNGAHTLNPISMSALMLFDTAGGQWSNVTAGGNIPAPRRGHSAVLSWDESSILIFGGSTPDEKTLMNDVFILELNSMRWTAPSIHGVPPKPRKYHSASLVDDLMIILFGIGSSTGGRGGYNDIGILSTSTWSWTSQYTSNPAWLSGNVSASHGLVKNSTGTYSSDTRSNSRDPNDAPFVQEQNITTVVDSSSSSSTSADDEGSEDDTIDHPRITAGVIAGVISGGVVVVGGGVFLIVTVIFYRRRRRRRSSNSNSRRNKMPTGRTMGLGTRSPNSSNSSSSSSTLSSTLSNLMVMLPRQKPDNRSSDHYAVQIDDRHHKPDDI